MLHRDFTPKPAWAAYRQAMVATDEPRGSLKKVVVTSRGVVRVRLACGGSAGVCAGTTTIVTRPIRQRAGQAKRRMRLGSRRVRIRAGRSKVVKFVIPRRHRPLLRRLKKVRAQITVPAPRRSATHRPRRRAVYTLQTGKIAPR